MFTRAGRDVIGCCLTERKHWPGATCGGQLRSQGSLIPEGSQDRTLEAAAHAEALESLLPMAQPDGSLCVLGPPTDLTTGQSDGGASSTGLSSS